MVTNVHPMRCDAHTHTHTHHYTHTADPPLRPPPARGAAASGTPRRGSLDAHYLTAVKSEALSNLHAAPGPSAAARGAAL